MRSLFLIAILSLAYLGAQPQEVQVREVQIREVQIRSGAWAPPPAARIAVQANLVEVGVVVRDQHDVPAGGFHAEDFELFDNRKPQAITFFAEENASAQQSARSAAPPPRSIALWVDDVHSGPLAIQKARVTAESLIRGIAPGERIGLFTSSGTVTVDLTRDTEMLLAAVARLRQNATPGPRELGLCPTFDTYRAFAISHRVDEQVRQEALARAIACNCLPTENPDVDLCIQMQPGVVDTLAAQYWEQFRERSINALANLMTPVRRLTGAPGSRLLLILSPGFIATDLELQMSRIINAAVRAHIVVNALNPEGLSTFNDQRQQELVTSGVMAEASAATGGKFIRNNNDLSGSARTLTAAPGISYMLGFSPAGKPDGKIHKLKVALKEGGSYRIQSRANYFSTEPEPLPETPQQRIDRTALSNLTVSEIPVFTSVAVKDPRQGLYTLRVDTQVDVRGLNFAGDDRRHLQQLTFVTIVQNAAGQFITGKMAVMDLELSSATLARFQADGIRTGTSFSVAPGTYRVRQVIREAVQDHFAATNTPVEIH